MIMDLHIRCPGEDNQYVKISTNSLPDNPYDVVYLLKVEFATRSQWRDVAAAYFELGKWNEGITVLEQATSDDVESALKGSVEYANEAKKCTRIDLLAALGGAHIMLADTQLNNLAARTETLRKAANVFSRADKIDLDDPSIWAARGWADFLQGKAPSAKDWFDNAREKHVILGAIGLAAIYLNRTRALDSTRTDAVTLLTAALRTKHCPPGVWTGLGYALFREGRFQDARNIARRAVRAVRNSAASERLEALYLLAVIETADHVPSSVENQTLALREAYVECNGHSDARILSLISELHFNGGDFEKAAAFASSAVAKSKDLPSSSIGAMYAGIKKSTLAQALFQLARAQHHLGNADKAIQGFEKIKKMVDGPDGLTLKVNPGYLLRLGLLKVSTGRKEDEPMAQECLEKVLKNSSERPLIAMRALGFLLGRRVLMHLRRGKPRGGESYQRAVSLLKAGLADDEGQKDVPAQLVYASLVEESSPAAALAAYQRAVEALKEQDEPVEPEIWVNMASLMARIGQYSEAMETLDKNVDKEFVKNNPVIAYNRGRISELNNEEEDAEEFFKQITSDHSHFLEAQVRLGVIAQRRGSVKEAEKLFKSAMNESSTRPMAAAFLSDLYTKQKTYKDAQEVLEQTRNECDYLMLAFSRFMHKFLDTLGTPERRNRFLINHIGTPVLHVLKHNKHNALAANAAGVYFAESSMLDEARDAFTAAGACQLAAKSARVNLAHTQMIQGRKLAKAAVLPTGRVDHRTLANAKSLFEQAEKLYSDAVRACEAHISSEGFKTYLELLHFFGCAQYNAEEHEGAVKTFQKVLHFVPSSCVTWFNLGLALFSCATARIRVAKSSLAEILKAKSELEASRTCFQKSFSMERRAIDPVTHTELEQKLAQDWYRYVRQETKRHEVTVVNARNDAEDREQKRKEKEVKLEEALQREKERLERIQAEKDRKQRELEAAAREAARKLLKVEEMERENLKREAELMEGDNSDGYGASGNGKPRKRRKKVDGDSDDGRKKRLAKNGKRSRVRLEKAGGESSDEYADDVDLKDLMEHSASPARETPKQETVLDSDGENDIKPARSRLRFAINSDSEGSDEGVKD